ncbi:MAG: ribose-phosphate diphosphokinase [Candidatus Kariarchaeaceae archaeon]
MQIIAGSNSIEFSKKLGKKLGWEVNVPIYKEFPDGETYLRLAKKPEEEVLIIQSLYNPQNSNLFQLCNLISTAGRLGAKGITVYTPYLCYSRSDREVLDFEAISSKTVIEMLESLGVKHLIALDVHNPAIFDFANSMKVTNIYPSKSFSSYFKSQIGTFDDITIIAPDKGAIDRARVLADTMGVPHNNLDKIRDPKTGDINVTNNDITVNTSSVILVDDMVSTGNSLVQASSLLRIMGVNEIHYFITHFLNTDVLDKLREVSDGIIVSSDSVPSIISKISSIDDLCEVLPS